MHAAVSLGGRAFTLAAAALFAVSAAAATARGQTVTVVPKGADARPKAYNIGGALALGDDAGYQFQSVTGPVRLDVGSVVNESTTNVSGTVRVALFVTQSPDPTAGVYWTVASTDLGTLQPGFMFGPLSRTVDYLAPPDGIFFIHMGAFEYEPATCTTASGFCLDDVVSFTNRVEVVNGAIYDAGPAPAPRAEAVEYYHAGFGHYFVTSFGNEIQLLDAGAFQGWARTGQSFPVWTADAGGMAGVCRFFSTSFAPKSSHFYTPFADECTTVRANRDWQFEAIAFFAEYPDTNGNCAAGRQPLYRLYNSGLSGAPNHRYTTSLQTRQQMLNQGWVSEGWGPFGTIACVPA